MKPFYQIVKFFVIIIGLVQAQDSPKICNDKGTCFKGALIEPGLATFQGIRYAQAPIGNLRFKPPILINQDNLGTIDASETSTVKCPQHADTSNLLKSSNSTGLYSMGIMLQRIYYSHWVNGAQNGVISIGRWGVFNHEKGTI